MILRPLLSNSIWNMYSYLGDGLPGRRSFKTETQTDPKVFPSVKGDNLKSLDEEKVSRLVQKLLVVATVTYKLQTADASEQFQKLVNLKSLVESLNEEANRMPPCSLKTAVEQMVDRTLKIITNIKLGRKDPFAELEKRVGKLEDFCLLDKNYGQKEFLWIKIMVTPDPITTEDQCVKEWKCKLFAIHNHQANLQVQYVDAETELRSIVKLEVENQELQVRVCLLFGRLAESFVKMEQDIKALEKEMDVFGKEYPKFQETREEISSKNIAGSKLYSV